MKKFKKAALTAASYVSVAALAIGGTLAYLADDEQGVNVMTVGNVDIELIEQQRSEDGSTLVDFVQHKELMPIVGSAQGTKDMWGMPNEAENYVDKIVTAKNTGDSDAYIRFIIAVPTMGDFGSSDTPLHWNIGNRFDSTGNGTYNTSDADSPYYEQFGDQWKNTGENVKINEIDYTLYTYTCTEAVAAGEVTPAVMTGFYLDSSVNYDDETNKWTCNGKEVTYDLSNGVVIPVQAQAVQVAGFKDINNSGTAADEAFAASDLPSNPWINGIYSADKSWYNENEEEFTLSTANELFGFAELVNNGTTFENKTVKLGADISLAGSEWTPIGKVPEGSKNVDFTTSFKGTFDGEGYTVSDITVNNEKHAGLFGLVYAGSITNVNVENVNITSKHWAGGVVGYLYGSKSNTNASITNCTAKNVTITCIDETGTDGDKAGGIVGWIDGYLSANYAVSNNSVDNVVITANRDAGAIAGYVRERDTLVFEDNTATNVKLTASGYCPENKDVNIPTDAENNLIGRYAE